MILVVLDNLITKNEVTKICNESGISHLFLSCQHAKNYTNNNIVLSYWLTFKFGLIFAWWHEEKRWEFIKTLLLYEFMNSYNFGTKKEWSLKKITDIQRFDDFFALSCVQNTWFWEWGVSIKSNSNSTWNYFLPFFRQIEIKMTKIFICEFRKDLASLYDVLSAFCVVACKDKKRDVH